MAKKPNQRKTAKNMETPAAAAPKTLAERLATAERLVEKLKAQINAEAQVNNVKVGDDVTFKFGRAEKARNLIGTIIGVADTEQGRLVAIQTGEGLDVEIKKVRASDIIENRTAAERTPEGDAETVEADPLNAA